MLPILASLRPRCIMPDYVWFARRVSGWTLA